MKFSLPCIYPVYIFVCLFVYLSSFLSTSAKIPCASSIMRSNIDLDGGVTLYQAWHSTGQVSMPPLRKAGVSTLNLPCVSLPVLLYVCLRLSQSQIISKGRVGNAKTRRSVVKVLSRGTGRSGWSKERNNEAISSDRFSLRLRPKSYLGTSPILIWKPVGRYCIDYGTWWEANTALPPWK